MGYGVDAVINPEGSLEVLSQREVNELCGTSDSGVYEVFRRCCLAVLNSGNELDDTRAVLAAHPDFSVRLVQTERGVKIEIQNAPPVAFVDGRMIRGIREHLSSVLRDVLFVHNEVQRSGRFNLASSQGITDAVFNILRNARIVKAGQHAPLLVCWGGHSISREEYEYTKKVGYELGLRGLNVCTGCGPGAMKGPMKGAAIGHAKQRIRGGRYIGLSEPGIIAAESPNPIVNDLVIMPDMEKRLEAFVRLGHGIIVFPGGVGTAEEMLYLLGILTHPRNRDLPFPLVLSGPASSESYFREFVSFIEIALGPKVSTKLRVIIDDPAAVASHMKEAVTAVMSYRQRADEAYYFNWALHLEQEFQMPFIADHQSMAQLALHRDQPLHQLACNLRRAFAGIVSGNVKDDGMRLVEAYGPFEIHGERAIMAPLDAMLRAFIAQQRMRPPGRDYVPCYRVVA
jgi:pyrimidine/purine-5'-nucleotide nucleosidase